MIVTIKDKVFRVRNCKDDDYRFVYNLLKRNMLTLFEKHWSGWNPKVIRESFNKNNIKIIELGTRRVAYYDVEFKENFSYIHNIQIYKSMQGRGLEQFY